MKSTAMSGVKQYLKPDAYKQSEGRISVIRYQISEEILNFDIWHLVSA